MGTAARRTTAGESRGAVSAEDYAAVAESLLDQLGVRGATLAYTCIGAFVAMLVARRRQDLVARLVLSQVPSLKELILGASGPKGR